MVFANESDLMSGLRWIAGMLGVASIATLLLFLFGEPSGHDSITWDQVVLLVLFPFGLMVGLILGWFRELLGGAVAVGSVLAFYLIEMLQDGSWPGFWFLVFATPGVIFLLHGVFAAITKSATQKIN